MLGLLGYVEYIIFGVYFNYIMLTEKQSLALVICGAIQGRHVIIRLHSFTDTNRARKYRRLVYRNAITLYERLKTIGQCESLIFS